MTRGQHPVRILFIGAGPAAVAMHFPVLAKLRDEGRAMLAEICDLDPARAEAAAQRFGFHRACGDADGALTRNDIDAVMIAGSAEMHYAYGLKAVTCGKHLFVEKPVAPSYAAALDLADEAGKRGLIAAGGHNRRFLRSLALVRARGGHAGWRAAEAVFHKAEWAKPVPYGAGSWLGANGIHALDALLFMMGELPEEIAAFAEARPLANFSVVMRWRDGALGTFLCNNHAGARREEYVFHAPDETCRVTDSALTIEAKGRMTRTRLSSLGDGVAAEHAAFLDAIASGVEPLNSLAKIAPSLRLAELIEAGYCGQVRLPEPVRRTARAAGPQPSVLVVEPAKFGRALHPLLPFWRLVSSSDVRDSTCSRADVVAALIGAGGAPLTGEVLDKLPSLALVAVAGLSLAAYQPEALLARGIALVNASAAYAESVAEFALGLAVLGRRRAFQSHAVMRSDGWGVHSAQNRGTGRMRGLVRSLRPALATIGLERLSRRAWRSVGPILAAPWGDAGARDLRGAAVGLIGWGANARAFTTRLLLAGARVAVWSEHAREGEIRAGGAVPASLAEVVASDIVSLHRALTPETRHAIGEAELARLRSGAVLINVARGALIEPGALVARLSRGDIFACLDTFEEEPPPARHPLRRLPNVFLTSHIAGGSPEMHAAAAAEVVEKVARFLARDDFAPLVVQTR